MNPEPPPPASGLSPREESFLNRLSAKYEQDITVSRLRSYVIAGVVLLALFALSRWIPWWGVALVVVEALGLTFFHQYKRFARFKSRLLTKLWRERGIANPTLHRDRPKSPTVVPPARDLPC
jgi:hypothetical protein